MPLAMGMAVNEEEVAKIIAPCLERGTMWCRVKLRRRLRLMTLSFEFGAGALLVLDQAGRVDDIVANLLSLAGRHLPVLDTVFTDRALVDHSRPFSCLRKWDRKRPVISVY